jgi:hypothetical protein
MEGVGDRPNKCGLASACRANKPEEGLSSFIICPLLDTLLDPDPGIGLTPRAASYILTIIACFVNDVEIYGMVLQNFTLHLLVYTNTKEGADYLVRLCSPRVSNDISRCCFDTLRLSLATANNGVKSCIL